MGLGKITRKGQMTIPKDVREMLGVRPGDYIEVVLSGRHAVIRPVRGGRSARPDGKCPAPTSGE